MTFYCVHNWTLKTKEMSKLKKIVNFKKENRDRKKPLKQDENTGNE